MTCFWSFYLTNLRTIHFPAFYNFVRNGWVSNHLTIIKLQEKRTSQYWIANLGDAHFPFPLKYHFNVRLRYNSFTFDIKDQLFTRNCDVPLLLLQKVLKTQLCHLLSNGYMLRGLHCSTGHFSPPSHMIIYFPLYGIY